MIKDVVCPHCKVSVNEKVSLFTDTVECPKCARSMKVGVNVIGFAWMEIFTMIAVPVFVLGMVIAHILGRDFILFPLMDWGPTLAICFLAIPALFLIIGYLTLGLVIGSIVKIVSWVRRS
jgi:uncharacterized membrane protein